MVSTVYIAKNVYGGAGLGRLGDGRVAFVEGAFAGEQVKAEIVAEKRTFVKARLIEIVERSADRIGELPPPVPGMVYANLAYAAERRAKAEQLKDFFERARLPAGDFAAVEAGEPEHYRNKVVYHFAKQAGRWAIGYRLEGSHTVQDVTDDPLAAPAINAALPEIRRAVTTLLTTGPQAVRRDTERKESLTIRASARSGVKWWLGEAPGEVTLKEETAGRVFEVPAGGFYQVNPVVADKLVRLVADEYVRGGGGDFLDLYCGVGVFGLSAVKAAGTLAGRLTGIESGRQAIEFARRNASALGVEARFYAERVGDNLRRIAIGPQTTVIVDPPRGGLEGGVAKWLAASRAPRIFYVSCDAATLVRDLREICRGYAIEKVRMLDMFPRTACFETLVVLKRQS